MKVQHMAMALALLLVYSCAGSLPKTPPEPVSEPAGTWLQRPRVRLVALTALGSDAGAIQNSVARWKQLNAEFRPLGLRIVAIAQPKGGVCLSGAPFAVDELVCDTGARMATALHLTKPGQSLLWDYRARQLIRNGDVKQIETAVRDFYDDLPRLTVCDPVIKDLPPKAGDFSRTRVYNLLEERLGADIKPVLTVTDPARRSEILRGVDPTAPAAPPACPGETVPKNGIVYSTVEKRGGALRLDLKWVDADAGCMVAEGSGVIGNGPDGLMAAVEEAVFPLEAVVKKEDVKVFGYVQGNADPGLKSNESMGDLALLKSLDHNAMGAADGKYTIHPMSITGIQGAPEVKPKDTPATQRYQARCDDGAVDDCVDLSWMLRNGEGVAVDFARARTLLEKACGLGAALGCNDLGLMHEQGEGMAVNDAKAVYYYQMSCTLGNSHGCRNWGLMLENGKGVAAADLDRAMELFRKSCDMQNGLACNDVGHLLEHGKGSIVADPAQAITFYQRSCEMGSGHGCTNLGFVYETGATGVTDAEQAARYYRFGCDYGNGTGCRDLGLLMVQGRGTPQDIVGANTMFSRACDLKDASGCRSLGASYEQGRGVTTDLQRALELYQVSCAIGSADGCVDAGYFYEQGMGAVRNYGRALELYLYACDHGNRYGCGNAGILYDTGRGVAKNLAAAIELYTKGCDMNNGGACRNLGLKYEKGTGFAPNVDTALKLYEKGCGLGDKAACNDVGYLYEYGTGGLMKNPPLSCTYYRKACDLGGADGCLNLKRLCNEE